MPRKKKVVEEAPSLLDITAKLRSGPCVPALREAVKGWRAADCKGITETTRTFLNYWFKTDLKLKTGGFSSITTRSKKRLKPLFTRGKKIRTRKVLTEKCAQNVPDLRLPPEDGFARYCTKMATGSGKTKVMVLVIAWQFFNAVREQEEIPNLVNFRLRSGVAGDIKDKPSRTSVAGWVDGVLDCEDWDFESSVRAQHQM